MSDEQVKEASWVVQSVSGASAYLHGVGYDKQTIKQEIAAAVEHIKKSA